MAISRTKTDFPQRYFTADIRETDFLSKLRTLAAAFDRSHPKFARATGGYSTCFRNNNMSIYALAMGYNVIKDATGSYHNVIDRKALVYKK